MTPNLYFEYSVFLSKIYFESNMIASICFEGCVRKQILEGFLDTISLAEKRPYIS